MFGLREFEYFIIRIKLENPLILVGSCKFHDLSPILHILEHAKKTGRSLVIAGEDIDKEVLSTILQNNEKSDLSSCAINFPGESNYSFLEDLANFTGATMINSYTINEIQLSDLGSSKKVNIDSMKSCFIDGKGDTSLRRSELSHEIINETDPMSQNVLRERLQRLSGKMVVIEMGVKGGKIAMGERRDRIVDSLNSVKSAIKEGFLPGGGSSLIYASRVLSKLRYGNESDIGIRILQDALKVPGYLIAKTSNIGIAAVDILLDQDDEEIGLDADKGDICNLVDRGIIDSTGVVRQAVRAAVSISQMILSTSAVVAKTVRYEPTRLHKYKKQMF